LLKEIFGTRFPTSYYMDNVGKLRKLLRTSSCFSREQAIPVPTFLKI
jgi:hypothetical protein